MIVAVESMGTDGPRLHRLRADDVQILGSGTLILTGSANQIVAAFANGIWTNVFTGQNAEERLKP